MRLLSQLWLGVLVLLATLAPAHAESETISAAQIDARQTVAATLPEMFAALGRNDWLTARTIARVLDQQSNGGDLMAAFVTATKLTATGKCYASYPLIQAIINASPNFFPAYDLAATCLVERGQAKDAARLYRDAAERLKRDNPERNQLLARANKLSPDLSPIVSVEFDAKPSTNINRGTDEATLGDGKIADKARRKHGMVVGAFAKIEKPVYATQRLFASVSLRAGASYNTHTERFMPEGNIIGTVRWLANEKTTVTGQAVYTYIMDEEKFLTSRPALTLGVSHRLTPKVTLDATVGVAHHRNAQDFLDGYSGFVSTKASKIMTPTDKVTAGLRYDWSKRRAETQNYNGFGVDAEWEHLWKNGLITSLGGGAYWRRYDAFAPLTNERQVNKSVFARVGLSHNKLVFGKIRPEVTYTATKQWSNDVFSEHVAHDVGFRAKAAF